MKSERTKKLIPTNIITGFLGVGKTTVIKHLLTQKPADERWAILINEFGEVGIDSSLFGENSVNEAGVTISQVPGGCMCCTNGLPMQMALNLLLVRARPHRLLIEPTGLGHPKEVLSTLSGEYYRDVLDIQATIALVDARKIRDSRYTSNTTFNEQVEIAEIIVASKSDLYAAEDFPTLLAFLEDRTVHAAKLVYQVRQGAVDLEWLTVPASQRSLHTYRDVAVRGAPVAIPRILETPVEGFVRADNSGEGYFSRGWIFNSQSRFNKGKLFSLINEIDAVRLKAVFLTSKGAFAINKTDDMVSQQRLQECADSRIEIISKYRETLDGIEESLLDCLDESEDTNLHQQDQKARIRNCGTV